MSIRGLIRWGGILLLAFHLVGCQVKRPETVLSDAKMEKVLYDYHVAKAMGEELPFAESYKKVLYIESVFKKHGITQAEFDSSMVWFARNPNVLTKIYEKVNLRLKNEREGINHLIALRENKPETSVPGDSIDLWAWRRVYRLTGMPLDNKVTFTFPADTNFKDRDTLRWIARFHFGNEPDSLSSPLMAMQLIYAKDTVDKMCRVRQTGVETVELFADTLGSIKEVRGFIYVPKSDTTVQHLLVDRIQLMRYHARDTFHVAVSDSVAEQQPEVSADEKQKEEGVRPDQMGLQPGRGTARPRPSSNVQRGKKNETPVEVKPVKKEEGQ